MSIAELKAYGLEEMTEDQRQAFLETQTTGVLGLSGAEGPYLLPMSFAFDGNSSLVFTFLLGSDSRKETLLDRTDQPGFLVYDAETIFEWRSVLLGGTVTEVPSSQWDRYGELLESAWRPELFRNAPTSRNVKLYRFDIDESSGVKHTGLAPKDEE